MPFLDRLEMVCISGWSRGAVYPAVESLESQGFVASISHATDLVPPTRRYCLTVIGIGTVTGRHLDSLKGFHVSAPGGGGYDIYYRQDLWDGAQEHTVLHEAYEIIHEIPYDLHSGSPPERKVCREADRFAAAVLMQPEAFASLAEQSGFDVLALQKAFRCSYASVALRLAEVVRDQPLMAVLYERSERGDPAGWAEPPALLATVARRTRDFGNPASFPISGFGGGVPRRGRPLPDGSLAERVVRYGVSQYAQDGGCAVPDRDCNILGPVGRPRLGGPQATVPLVAEGRAGIV